MSVVLEYLFPVRVFCAVTATPGRGMLPLFTTPWSLPPATGCGCWLASPAGAVCAGT